MNSIDPIGQDRDDFRMAILSAALFNSQELQKESGGPFRAEDFLPLFKVEPHKDRKQDVNKLIKSIFGVPDDAGKS